MDISAIKFDDDRERSLLRYTCYHRWMLLPRSLRQEDPPYDETLEAVWVMASATMFAVLRRRYHHA